jgi:ribonuclease Z
MFGSHPFKKIAKWVAMAGASALAIAAVLLGTVYMSETTQDAVFHRALRHLLDRNPSELFSDDALRVIVCGSGSPQPTPKAAKSCIAVIAGGKMYVVDVGPGSSSNLAIWRLPTERIAGVFLTHFHSDHMGDLGELNMQSWNFGRTAPLQVYGPPGVEQVVDGLSKAYGFDQSYRSATHGDAILALANGNMQSHTIAMPSPDNGAFDRTRVVLDSGGLKITAIEVNHKPVEPAYGYRFDYKGRSVVISGDTVFHLPLAKAAQGADVLFHEAQAQHMMKMIQQASSELGQTRLSTIVTDVQRYHTTTLEAAEIANRAQVKLLAIYHTDPPVLNPLLQRIFVRGIDAVRHGDWLISKDGTLVELPLSSHGVHVSSVGSR